MPSPTPLRSLPTFLPTQLYVLHPSNAICVDQLLLDVGPVLKCGQYSRVTSLNKTDFLISSRLTLACQLETGLPSPRVKFCLASACSHSH
ncbi:hypothetical protein I79_014987 [Cricetulus griseus]|uniref:Uncharacterized protein n=1 Tax=Cricetulus griseus TaxID=10029 RepID=G3HVJ8_CRIGR|nr:hypothetical protein I79_014987 [Cricetulus griseus]